jgi:hypothetical protein
MSEEFTLHDSAVLVFQREIRRQSEMVLVSLPNHNENLNTKGVNQIAFWYTVDAMIGAMARAGDILWPAQKRGESKKRGKFLREIWGLSDDSILADKAVRNSFEHYAERIDTWAGRPDRIFVDSVIHDGNSGVHGVEALDTARSYDRRTHTVTMFGDSFNIQEAVEEIEMLLQTIPDPHPW